MRLRYQVWLLGIAVFQVASVGAFQPKVGAPLPDFILPRIENGEPVSLSTYRGHNVLLVMFASW